jgi:hypothetical protein
MIKHWAIFAACILSIIFANRLVFADGQLGPESDILGFNLSMRQAQAKNYAQTHFKGRPLVTIPVKINTSDYRKDAVLGFLLEVKSGNSNSPVIKEGIDLIKVVYNPNNNSNDIYAISRIVNYGYSKSRITKATVIDSLVTKYGQPSKIVNHGHDAVLTWLANDDIRISKTCMSDRPPLHEAVYGDRSIQANADGTSDYFVGTLNAKINPGLIPRRNCGLMLIIIIRANVEYAYQMEETLIDYSKGVSEWIDFRNDFNTNANESRNKRVTNDLKNKPQL